MNTHFKHLQFSFCKLHKCSFLNICRELSNLVYMSISLSMLVPKGIWCLKVDAQEGRRTMNGSNVYYRRFSIALFWMYFSIHLLRHINIATWILYIRGGSGFSKPGYPTRPEEFYPTRRHFFETRTRPGLNFKTRGYPTTRFFRWNSNWSTKWSYFLVVSQRKNYLSTIIQGKILLYGSHKCSKRKVFFSNAWNILTKSQHLWELNV